MTDHFTDAERLAAARMQVARLREALKSAITSIEEEWDTKAVDLREALDLSEEVAVTDARIDELIDEIGVAARRMHQCLGRGHRARPYQRSDPTSRR
jgi:hypothetical protein